MRSFNGDVEWDPLQAALQLLHLAPTVWSRHAYSCAEECLDAVLAAAVALPGNGFGAALNERCVGDVASLLRQGSMSTLRALREATELVSAAAASANCQDAKSQRRFFMSI